MSLLTNFEPKKSFHFLVELKGLDAYLVKSIKLPKWTAYQGKGDAIEPLELFLYDPVSPSGAQQVMNLTKKASLEPLDFNIKLLDACGTVASIWQIGGATVDHVDFGDLSYGNSKPIEIKVVFNIKSLDLTF